jgi:hypothetical protein
VTASQVRAGHGSGHAGCVTGGELRSSAWPGERVTLAAGQLAQRDGRPAAPIVALTIAPGG